MIKRISLLLSVLYLALIMTACQSAIDTDLTVVLSDINTQCDIHNMKVLEDKDELYQYYLIEVEDVEDFAAEISTKESDMTEIIFVKAMSRESAQRVAGCLNNYYKTRVDMANSYDAQYLKVLTKCSVEQKGVYVSLIISEKVDTITNIYDSYFK